MQDVDDAIDYHWKSLTPEGKQFLMENAHELSLKKLVDFWLRPHRVAGEKLFAGMCGASWYLAHLFLCKKNSVLSKALLMNGAFLQQCYVSLGLGYPFFYILKYLFSNAHIVSLFSSSYCHFSFVQNTPTKEIIQLCKNVDKLKDQDIRAKLPLFCAGFSAISNQESMMRYLTNTLPSGYRRMMGFASQTAHGPVLDYINHISSDWNSTSSSSNHKNKGAAATNDDADNSSIEIIFRDLDTDEQVRMTIGLSTSLKTLFNEYSEQRGTSLRSLRFSYEDKTLFLSSAGHKTPSQLGMNDLDSVSVSMVDASPSRNQEIKPRKKSSTSSSLQGKKKKKCNKKGNMKKSRINSPSFIVDDCAKFKIKHSRALTKLFEEAEPKFREIRQQLNALYIERTEPKVKTSQKKTTIKVQKPTNNPSVEGIGCKAGKTSFVVQVGEVDNLYKTSKPSVRNNHALYKSHPIMLDLHGFTKDQALSTLDQDLPKWTDIAMQGSYPFVQPVIIVCGGGNQILSESVEHWIKQNDRVSNAPKNCFSRIQFTCCSHAA